MSEKSGGVPPRKPQFSRGAPHDRLTVLTDLLSDSIAKTVQEVIGGEELDSIIVLVQGLHPKEEIEELAEGVTVGIGTTLSPDELPMVLYRALAAMLSPEMMAEVGRLLQGEEQTH